VAEFSGQLAPVGRIGIVVSRYHERITTRLLEGARDCCREAGIPPDDVDVVWVPGAFELGSALAALARSGRYAALVALGVVIRGETPHFDYVAGEAARGIGEVARLTGLPVTFGVITADTMAQAEARSGGAVGNKGREAALAALGLCQIFSALGRRPLRRPAAARSRRAARS
jgi:6,7-dimethyl-8-ribityllumazine synthase